MPPGLYAVPPASRWNSPAARRALLPARRVRCMMRASARRACSAAVLSGRQRNGARSTQLRQHGRAKRGARHERNMTSGAMSGIGVEAYTFDKDVVEKAYAGWAPIYDVVFGAVFAPGRAAAVRAAERVGGAVLDDRSG